MFEKRKTIRDIRKKTGCTRKQAKYLMEGLSKAPKMKDFILQHLDELDLRNCNGVIISGDDRYLEISKL